MGKVIGAARDEVAKCAAGCRFYAEHAEAFLTPEQHGPEHQVLFQPLGTVLAIMPWNFPFWQTVRFAAPALAAGNVGVLKHSSNVPQCALALEDVFLRAGAPQGVFQTLLIGSDLVERVIADPRVAAVTLTGSEGAGRSVAATAGHHLKKTVLELGGSDPFVVLASADISRAAEVAVKARVVNNGQSCIAAKRFIVVDAVYAQFLAAFSERMRALRVGDPMDESTDVGPLATAAIRDELARQVADSIAAGAQPFWAESPRNQGRPCFTRPRFLWMCRPARRRPVRNCSGRWRRCFARPMPITRWRWPTTPPSALAPASGPEIAGRPSASRASWRRDRSSSMTWWHRIPAFRSGGSNAPDTVGS